MDEIREYKVIYELGKKHFNRMRYVKAYTAADAITQLEIELRGLEEPYWITMMVPVQEDTKQKYGGKCADCEWDDNCSYQAEQTEGCCQGPYKGV